MGFKKLYKDSLQRLYKKFKKNTDVELFIENIPMRLNISESSIRLYHRGAQNFSFNDWMNFIQKDDVLKLSAFEQYIKTIIEDKNFLQVLLDKIFKKFYDFTSKGQ